VLNGPSFAALRYRNFRLLWWSQLISFSGSTMQTAAILWHVSLLVASRHKGLALGMVGLVRVVPIVFFSLLSGVVADALDRRRLLLLTQTSMAVLAGALAVLTFRGLAAVWPVYLLTALSAAAGSFDSPARQSLIPSLVPREHLPNAISLNTTMFQIASVAGPSLAGVTIAAAGVGWVYVINALSFIVVIVALVMMRDVPHHGEAGLRITARSALEGLRFVFASPMIRSTMLLDFFATFFSSATTLLPIYAQDILRVGATGYGWLYAAPSFGAVAAGLIMVPILDRIQRRGAVLVSGVFVYGAATVVFGLSSRFWLTFLCLGLTGASDTVAMILRNLVRQLETPDRLRGRMTGVNMVFFMGGPQLGELEAGLVANWWGAPFSVVTGGVACLFATALIAYKTPALARYRREESYRTGSD
jgi:MFS family permease